MEYLGFLINSLEMKLLLPEEKMTQLIQICKDLILEKKGLSENSLSDYWETDLIYTGSFSSTPPLPAFAKAPSKGFVDGQGVRNSCPSE